MPASTARPCGTSARRLEQDLRGAGGHHAGQRPARGSGTAAPARRSRGSTARARTRCAAPSHDRPTSCEPARRPPASPTTPTRAADSVRADARNALDERRAVPVSRRRGSRRRAAACASTRAIDLPAGLGLLVDEHGGKPAARRVRRRDETRGPRADHREHRLQRAVSAPWHRRVMRSMPRALLPLDAHAVGAPCTRHAWRFGTPSIVTRQSKHTPIRQYGPRGAPVTGVVRQRENAGREHRRGDRVARARRARDAVDDERDARTRARGSGSRRNIEARGRERARAAAGSAPCGQRGREQPRVRGGERDAAVAGREERAGTARRRVVHREAVRPT